MFIYEIQAFAYSNFEHYILLHEKQFNKIQFRKMIEKSRQKAKQKAEDTMTKVKKAIKIDYFEE